MGSFGLYIHIPFCLQRCPYCDFNTYATTNLPEKEYSASLLAELDFRAADPEWKGRTIRSIYFGGGTPSLLSPSTIERLINFITASFPIEALAEISLEANPGTISGDNLKSFYDAGVNRLSLGTQSFNPDILRTLGRIHSPEQCESAICDARMAGFKNLSIDLMYGIPGQSLSDWRADLKAAVRFAPDHISAYGLTIEKGTPFYESVKRGTLKIPEENTVIKMMGALNAALSDNGFSRYEISNYARPGREARHNLAYWNYQDYLGLGAGAHSFLLRNDPAGDDFGLRWANFAEPIKYMREVNARGKALAWEEKLDQKEAMFEYFFLGLRKVEGVSLERFKHRFGLNMEEAYPSVIEILKEQRYASVQGDRFQLSDRGLMLADSVFEFFASDKAKVKIPISPDMKAVHNG